MRHSLELTLTNYSIALDSKGLDKVSNKLVKEKVIFRKTDDQDQVTKENTASCV